jgi:uncharacterized protein
MNLSTITTIIAFIGEVFGTITGLGNATFFVPMLSYFTSFDRVLGIVAFIHVFSNITRMSFFWKNISTEVFVKFGISNIIFVTIGAFFTKFVDINIIEIFLGAVLMAFSLYEIIFKKLVIFMPPKLEVLSGAVAGFFGGLVGTSGPFRSFVLINMGLSKEVYIATSVAVDFIGDVLRLLVYIFNGFVNNEIITILPIVFLASFIGAFVGQKVLYLIPAKIFNNLVIFFLFMLGFGLAFKHIDVAALLGSVIKR